MGLVYFYVPELSFLQCSPCLMAGDLVIDQSCDRSPNGCSRPNVQVPTPCSSSHTVFWVLGNWCIVMDVHGVSQ